MFVQFLLNGAVHWDESTQVIPRIGDNVKIEGLKYKITDVEWDLADNTVNLTIE